jgi:hypothetical protein
VGPAPQCPATENQRRSDRIRRKTPTSDPNGHSTHAFAPGGHGPPLDSTFPWNPCAEQAFGGLNPTLQE